MKSQFRRDWEKEKHIANARGVNCLNPTNVIIDGAVNSNWASLYLTMHLDVFIICIFAQSHLPFSRLLSTILNEWCKRKEAKIFEIQIKMNWRWNENEFYVFISKDVMLIIKSWNNFSYPTEPENKEKMKSDLVFASPLNM